jgi:nucleotide-binding universal stress UspA family protein
LHVFPAYRLRPPLPLPIGRDVLGAITAQIQEETKQIKSLFDDATEQQPFVSEWRSITSERTDPALIVMNHGRACDLIIACQSDPGWDLSSILDFPERLAIEGGRPVLVLPIKGRFESLPKSITVAWNGRKESARAVFDALPLLKLAEKVEVLTVDQGDGPLEGSLPDTELAAALDRHGVNVTVAKFAAVEASVGEAIRRRATEQSDLLVMGAYGHSRFREFAFGGVTRHILREMTEPVLFSH